MKILAGLITLFALQFCQSGVAGQPEPAPDEASYLSVTQQTWDALDRRQGTITLPNGVATLDVPDDFYYLDPSATETVLVQIWGNPPGIGRKSQGMLIPAQSPPYARDGWGVTIDYEQDGHVSDADADSIDYDALLADMQADTRQHNEARVKQGYESIELIGWAARPHYDAQSHKLYWAQELKFGETQAHTLNYNIRMLGRKGVLVLNFIADMDQKPVIDANLDTVLALADFDQGARYQDFNPDLDAVATYGIGALVAGKVAAKAGLFAAALIFLKKFGVLILAGVAMLGRKLFQGKTA